MSSIYLDESSDTSHSIYSKVAFVTVVAEFLLSKGSYHKNHCYSLLNYSNSLNALRFWLTDVQHIASVLNLMGKIFAV